MKVISSYYASYTLVAGGYLSVTSTGTIGDGFFGGGGGQGLSALQGGTVINDGLLETTAGLFGANGQSNASGSGSAGYSGHRGGYAGADLAMVSMTNHGMIVGGFGGFGGNGGAGSLAGGAGGQGGAGSSGVVLTGSGLVTNGGAILGGAGGKGGMGGAGGYAHFAAGNGAAGGPGGTGVSLSAGTLVNSGSIHGGDGGFGGYGGVGNYNYASGNGANGGGGGIGVAVYSAYVTNHSLIQGGKGGQGAEGGPKKGVAGAAGTDGASASGGAGLLLAGGSVANYGTIEGGVGGAGAGTFYSTTTALGYGAQGGAGAIISPGTLDNDGVILGGKGGKGHYVTGAYGSSASYGLVGDGVDVRGAGVLVNGASGKITGYVGVRDTSDAGGVTVINAGSISGVDLTHASDRLVAEGGSYIYGFAAGGGGTLEMKGGISGAIQGLGATAMASGYLTMTFLGFGSYVFDARNYWNLYQANTVAADKSLTNAGDLNIYGTLTDEGAMASTGTLATGAKGEVLVGNGVTLQAAGAVANAGTIQLGSAGANTDLRILSAGATLSGGGVVQMNGARARIVGAASASTLVNTGDTILGEGFLGAGQLTFDNAAGGLVEATGDLVVGTGAKTIVNAGRLEAAASGVLVIASTTVANSGTILAAGGRVDLQASDVIGGTVAGTGGGRMDVNSGASTLDGTAGAVTLSGVIQVDPGTTLTAVGSIAGAGQVSLFASKLVIGAAGVTLSGRGQVNLDASAANLVTGASAAATLANVNDRISGAGQLGGGSMTLVNAAGGVITDTLAKGLTIDTGTHVVQNAGTIAGGIGGVTVASAVSNTGEFLAAAGTLSLNGVVTGSGSGRIAGGVLAIGAHPFAETVTFVAGKGGALQLKDSLGFTGKVAGLSTTGANSLDLGDIAFKNGVTKASYAGTAVSGVLSVTDGAHTAKITLAGDYRSATFALSADGHGGTKVVDPAGPARPSLVMTAPLHPFIAAAASLGAAAGGLASPTVPAWGASATMLARPGRIA